MSRITIDLSDKEEMDLANNCCREGENIKDAILRIIICEIKSKKLQVDLRDKK